MNWLPPSFSRTVTLSGLGVAGVGFFLTRFTVTLAVYDEPMQFYLAGLVPLVLGLSLAAFGVTLVVGPFGPEFVRTTTVWCLAGAGTMFLLGSLTVAGSNPHELAGIESVLSETYVSNFLIGGSVGGTLTGVYAAQNARHRNELEWQANRLVTLNRILRHEVLNAITVISGHADIIEERGTRPDGQRTVGIIQRKSDHIVETIEDVESLTETGRSPRSELSAVDPVECLEASLESVRSRHPDAEYVVNVDDAGEVSVAANSRLEDLFRHLLENAVVHNPAGTPRVEIDLELGKHDVTVRVADDGPGLPDHQRSILEDGTISERDDPSSGFGINVVRLLAERFHADVRTTVTDAGTIVEVALARVAGTSRRDSAGVRSYGIAPSSLVTIIVASLLAGGVMGGIVLTTAGVIPVIGALYGASNPVVGWIAHEFHSVVFGLVYAGGLTVLPGKYTDGLRGRLAVGVAWGVILWAVAAGVVMPIWLRLVGIPASVPSLEPSALASHLVWGSTLGIFYYLGNERFEADLGS